MPTHVHDQPAHLILWNARIYTGEPNLPWAEAIAIRGEKLQAIGTNETVRALTTPATRHFDLKGRLILPGLCDSHIHMHEWSSNLARPQLAAARSRAQMLDMIARYAATRPPNAWIVCQGWNESWWGEADFFTASDLDQATRPTQPAIAYRSDMHIAVANHAALDQAAITATTPDPPGGVIDRDATGQPTGLLRELAIGLVSRLIPPPSHRETVERVRLATAELHRLGITAVHDQRIKDGEEGPLMLAAYQALRDENALQLRVNTNVAAHNLPALAALGLRSGFGNDRLRLGHIKVFSDGSLGSRTAWMLAPFTPQSPDEPPNYGVNVTPPEQMAQEFAQAQQLGFPISVHAIGDRANRVVLDIFEELAPRLPSLPIPHRIEHVQTIDPVDIPRLARLNITASVQPVHLTDDRELTERYWGDRAANTYAFYSLHKSGVRLAFGSDAPVADPNPFLGMHAACVRRQPGDSRPSWQPQERLDLTTIVDAYTIGPALATGWHTTIGSLAPGKAADLIVVDRDIFELSHSDQSVDALAETTVLATLFAGAVVYHAPGSPIA